MKDLKKIQFKSIFYLFSFGITQTTFIFLSLREGKALSSEFPLGIEIQENLWTYFNIFTIIMLLLAFRMGKSAINKVPKEKETIYLGIRTLLKLSIFTFANSLFVFYAYHTLLYENNGFYAYFMKGFDIFSPFFYMSIILIIPSVMFGAIYGIILEKITKPLFNPNNVI